MCFNTRNHSLFTKSSCPRGMFIMVALCNGADHYIFALWFLEIFLLFFFPRLISAVGDWMSLPNCYIWCGPSANLECRSEICCTPICCQPNFAALNRERRLYSAGRPSLWALAHILVTVASFLLDSTSCGSTCHIFHLPQIVSPSKLAPPWYGPEHNCCILLL